MSTHFDLKYEEDGFAEDTVLVLCGSISTGSGEGDDVSMKR